MPPIRAGPGLKPVRYERTHEENQERLVTIFAGILFLRLTVPERILRHLVEVTVVSVHVWSLRGARQSFTKNAPVEL
jgi:hypothetical protein